MTKPITNPSPLYATLQGNQSASLLDNSFSPPYTAINDILTYSNGFDDTGSANAYAVTIASPLTFTLTKYVRLQVLIANTNSGASTLTVNGGGSTAIVAQNGSALIGGELQAGRIAEFQYDGSAWQVLSSSSALGTSTPVPVRQTVLAGSTDSNGQANWLVIGTGLQINYSATATPVPIAFANGFSSLGSVDQVALLFSDATNQFGTLAANTTSYLYGTRASSSSITGASTIIPPQYGEVFDRTRQTLMHFEGVNAATLSAGNWTTGNQPGDDYGATFTTNGNAQLDTSQFKIGSSSLKLDGTGDYIEGSTTAGFQFPPNGQGWTIECYVRWNVLPTAGQNQVIFSFGLTANDFAAEIHLNNTTGTLKLAASLSSNGSSFDIASASLGSATTWATNTWYHLALTYDPIAGKYFVYKDGTSDQSITSSLSIAIPTKMRIGSRIDGTLQQLNGWVDEFRVSPCCRYPNGTTFTPYTTAQTPEGHFFSIPQMKMYEVTAACSSAGSDPTLTNRSARVFVGEADAGAATISAVRSYAYRGRYASATGVATNSTATTYAHNIGVPPKIVRFSYVAFNTDSGYQPGTEMAMSFFSDGSNNPRGATFVNVDRNNSQVLTGQIGLLSTAFAFVSGTAASWRIKSDLQRGW